MNKTIARCTMISAMSVWIIISITNPWILGDKNVFLKNFVNHEVLNFLGVIVAITLASSANLHLEFNRIEREAKKLFLFKTRYAVKKSAFGLIAMLIISIIIVTIKPLIITNQTAESFVNGSILLILLGNILVLIDITQLVFRIEPRLENIDD